MGKAIAITGKGGTGKTTVAALVLRELLRSGVRPVLAIDGDPNHTLGQALGIEPDAFLADIRDEVRDNPPPGVSKIQYADQRFNECIHEAEGFDLLTMGRPEGPGCYCYVNNLLREGIHKLRGNYQAVLIDNAAGMEHISRLVTDEIDTMVFVCEPTVMSIRTAARINRLTDSLPVRVGKRLLVVSRVPDAGLPEEVDAERATQGLPDPFLVADCPAVTEIWNSGRSFLGDNADLPSLKGLIDAAGF